MKQFSQSPICNNNTSLWNPLFAEDGKIGASYSLSCAAKALRQQLEVCVQINPYKCVVKKSRVFSPNKGSIKDCE